ncbi:MAG: sulfide/dihydroorotate dehydrogenase-like FAD/NAD-binding protein [Firmicutes bacterium]|nr:sulfide/dihydroorotate dehydrogenase-like FAD/NAD-binding protein [Bacillota bacterium]MBQ6891010.1 sulfide/dihydroorotate dehydrogenase-like FAD/NAD-binding protein [Clostridia bacterium]MBQ3287377.1 sulfide/dihydroorotate dehydrogenase-like FAD/NAD-binding protein [Bacillota bacterium]MBQ6606434.1 sulfide/dihydroorotate dehydrogenase-like FAD/NAD-binding protein [Bacillota bacterium]MBR0179108.1 sulfide/dihydroorotate dehydrogenase-like FAD/NAD-binding protein [Bacillota bacterium]
MFPIVTKKQLNPTITYMEILAPAVARKAMPGQFIMLRINEDGERIPLTIAGYDREKGTVTIIFQKVGYTTYTLDTLNEGDALLDFVGPLGCASEFEQYVGKHVCVVGGGLGVAIAYPQAKALHELGAKVDFIVGFKNKDLIILEDEFKNACENLFVLTDDGSNGNKGFVTVALEEQLKKVDDYEAVIAIGPLMMMKAVCDMTRPKGIKTIVSMNSLMVDGTGMCGCCRVQVGGETKFACVDGPDFDGHQVDFDLAMRRGRMYIAEEKESMKKHECRMGGAK